MPVLCLYNVCVKALATISSSLLKSLNSFPKFQNIMKLVQNAYSRADVFTLFHLQSNAGKKKNNKKITVIGHFIA